MRLVMLMPFVLLGVLGASACRRNKDATPRALASHGPHGIDPDKLNRARTEQPAAIEHDAASAK